MNSPRSQILEFIGNAHSHLARPYGSSRQKGWPLRLQHEFHMHRRVFVLDMARQPIPTNTVSPIVSRTPFEPWHSVSAR